MNPSNFLFFMEILQYIQVNLSATLLKIMLKGREVKSFHMPKLVVRFILRNKGENNKKCRMTAGAGDYWMGNRSVRETFHCTPFYLLKFI